MPLSYNWSSAQDRRSTRCSRPAAPTRRSVWPGRGSRCLQTAPLNAPAEDPNYTYKHAIILLSDGLNTEDRWPAYGNGSTQFGGQIDARQKILCDNIKAAGHHDLYDPGQYQQPADPTSTVLSNCASGPQNFFMLTSASQIVTTFNSIGTSLSQLRVAR